jgi:hypothetical protein
MVQGRLDFLNSVRAKQHSSFIGSLGVQSRRNVHRCQLLKEQLGRVGNVYLRDLVLVVACFAFKRVLLEFPVSSSAHAIARQSSFQLTQ